MTIKAWFMPTDPDAPIYQVGVQPEWLRDADGRWRADPGESPAAMLRNLWTQLHTLAPDLLSIEQFMRAFGVPVPKRSEVPALVAERIRLGDSRADAVRLVAMERCMSEGAVRKALSEEARNPRPTVAQQIWVGDEDGTPVLLYDVGYDDRYVTDHGSGLGS